MANQQLLDYIKQQLQRGVSREDIRNALFTIGWQEKDVEEAFDLVSPPEEAVLLDAPKTAFPKADSFSRKISKKAVAVFASVILALLLIGGGVFGYFYYFQSPERVVQKMVEKMVEIESLEYAGQITIITENGGASSILNKVSIDFSGASDLHNLNNPKAMFKFDISINILAQVFGLEVRTVNNIIYFKLNNIPDLGFFDLSLLENQWIKIDPEAIRRQFGLEELAEQIEEAQREQALSPEQEEQIKEAVLRIKIFQITEKLPSEKIGGIDTYHYKFVVDTSGIAQLFDEINKIAEDRPLTEVETQELMDALQEIEMLEGELWIGKKDLLLYKIFLELSDKDKKNNVTLSVQFKNYNKPVQIDIPTPAKTLEEIMSMLFDGESQSEQLELPILGL